VKDSRRERMKKEKTGMTIDELHNLSLEQKRDLDGLPDLVKERIEELDKESREEMKQKISELCNLDDATCFEKYPVLIQDGLKKDIHRILGMTYEDLSADVMGEKFLLNIFRFFIFKLNSIIN
jgi:hypothetical protein